MCITNPLKISDFQGNLLHMLLFSQKHAFYFSILRIKEGLSHVQQPHFLTFRPSQKISVYPHTLTQAFLHSLSLNHYLCPHSRTVLAFFQRLMCCTLSLHRPCHRPLFLYTSSQSHDKVPNPFLCTFYPYYYN